MPERSVHKTQEKLLERHPRVTLSLTPSEASGEIISMVSPNTHV